VKENGGQKRLTDGKGGEGGGGCGRKNRGTVNGGGMGIKKGAPVKRKMVTKIVSRSTKNINEGVL